MLTDLRPHQQAAATIMQLGGAAREQGRLMSPQEMMHGGILNGVQVDPVTYLLGGLHAKFSALEEESRLIAMTEMLAFARKPGEHDTTRYVTEQQSKVNLLCRLKVVHFNCAVQLELDPNTSTRYCSRTEEFGHRPSSNLTICALSCVDTDISLRIRLETLQAC